MFIVTKFQQSECYEYCSDGSGEEGLELGTKFQSSCALTSYLTCSKSTFNLSLSFWSITRGSLPHLTGLERVPGSQELLNKHLGKLNKDQSVMAPEIPMLKAFQLVILLSSYPYFNVIHEGGAITLIQIAWNASNDHTLLHYMRQPSKSLENEGGGTTPHNQLES